MVGERSIRILIMLIKSFYYNMKPIYKIVSGKAWYCLSIFYSRNAWLNLLLEISSFYDDNAKLFHRCLIYLSEERGEHIRITFLSDVENINAIQNRIENHFLHFLKSNPSDLPEELPLGKELWCHYSNNTLVWNQYEIQYQTMDLSFDAELLACLSGFQNAGQAEEREQEEEKAFDLLEQIQQEVATAPDGIRLAKWGCLVECLVRNSFVEAEVDDLLAETDEFLIALWHEIDVPYVDISQLFLWMCDYFLFRLCGEESQFRSRYFNVIEQMLFRIVHLFQKPEHSAIYVEPIFLFPTNLWQDMEWWLRQIDEYSVCPLAKEALNNLYVLRDSEALLHSNSPKDVLRWQLRNSYFSK